MSEGKKVEVVTRIPSDTQSGTCLVDKLLSLYPNWGKELPGEADSRKYMMRDLRAFLNAGRTCKITVEEVEGER